MNEDPAIQHDDKDGEVWARIYIATLSSPVRSDGLSATELAQYARAVADRYVAFRRACRQASEDVHHSRSNQANRLRGNGPTHLGAWRGVNRGVDPGAGRDEPR